HRLMLKDKNRLGVSLHSRRRLFEFHRRAEERGQPLPAAITLGIHPLHYMGSMVYAYPPHVRKFEIIGGVFGEPHPLPPPRGARLPGPPRARIIPQSGNPPPPPQPARTFRPITPAAPPPHTPQHI